MSKSIDNGGERGGRQDADEMRHGTLAEARDGARDTATAGRIPHGRAAEAGRRRPDTAAVPELLQLAGGLRAGAARDISQRTGVAEADVYGVGSFFHLLARPDVDVRVCTGLSCQLRGADALLAAAKERGWSVEGCSCLAACDRPTPILIGREMHYDFDAATLAAHVGPHTTLPLTAAELAAPSAAVPAAIERAACGVIAMAEDSVFELDREPSFAAAAFERAASIGSASLFDEIERSGLQGRGGAG
ncbi:MAG: NAD(P)H-dependent oxidoreductase subunit E, partial [Myxococcales bacterium]|nr:NAD(P)H-dependent oxidoreductase subunit E [Myxococcales bacterium]